MKRCGRTKSPVSGRLPRVMEAAGRVKARSLDMHALAEHSGGHLPGVNTARWLIESERPVEIERSVESESPVEIEDSRTAAPAARLALAQRPVLELRHFIQPVQHPRRRRSPAAIPGQPTRTGALPGRTPPPPPDSKKKSDERGSGGGRFLIQPNDDEANASGKAPADSSATSKSPSLSTFGGFAPRNPANPSDTAADQNGNNALQPINGKDPIRPLIVSPELSPQLSQFGTNSNGGSFARGPAVNGVSPLLADPTAHDTTKDPIRPLNLLPPTSLPLGNSRSGLPVRRAIRRARSRNRKPPFGRFVCQTALEGATARGLF